jgi:hypothetical protein
VNMVRRVDRRGESSRPLGRISSISKPRYYSLGISCFWDGRWADRGTTTIVDRIDPKEVPMASGIRRVEVWGFLGMGAVAVSDHLRLDAI